MFDLKNNTKRILHQYSKYYDLLQRLGENPMMHGIKLEGELRMTRAEMQSCYREIKAMEIIQNGKNLSLVDFLCLISLNYILLEWNKRLELDKRFKEGRILSLGSFVDTFVSVLLFEPKNANNFIRLFHNDPDFFFKSDVFLEEINKFSVDNIPDCVSAEFCIKNLFCRALATCRLLLAEYESKEEIVNIWHSLRFVT